MVKFFVFLRVTQSLFFLAVGACCMTFYQSAVDQARAEGMASAYLSMSVAQLTEVEVGA